jgi:hypothetical protein
MAFYDFDLRIHSSYLVLKVTGYHWFTLDARMRFFRFNITIVASCLHRFANYPRIPITLFTLHLSVILAIAIDRKPWEPFHFDEDPHCIRLY